MAVGRWFMRLWIACKYINQIVPLTELSFSTPILMTEPNGCFIIEGTIRRKSRSQAAPPEYTERVTSRE